MSIHVLKTMSEQQLEAFLKERGAEPLRIEAIEQSFSREKTRKYLESTNQRSDEVFVERAISVMRARFAEKLKGYEKDGMPFEDAIKIFGL